MKPSKVAMGIVLGLLVVALLCSARVRATAFGAWGYAHFTTLSEKIKLINDPSVAWAWNSDQGESLMLGAAAEFLPHSGEFIEVASVNPICLNLVLHRPDPLRPGAMTEARIPMEQTAENTFRYDSRQYPISIAARVIGVSNDSETPSVRLVIRAEPK